MEYRSTGIAMGTDTGIPGGGGMSVEIGWNS